MNKTEIMYKILEQFHLISYLIVFIIFWINIYLKYLYFYKKLLVIIKDIIIIFLKQYFIIIIKKIKIKQYITNIIVYITFIIILFNFYFFCIDFETSFKNSPDLSIYKNFNNKNNLYWTKNNVRGLDPVIDEMYQNINIEDISFEEKNNNINMTKILLIIIKNLENSDFKLLLKSTSNDILNILEILVKIMEKRYPLIPFPDHLGTFINFWYVTLYLVNEAPASLDKSFVLLMYNKILVFYNIYLLEIDNFNINKTNINKSNYIFKNYFNENKNNLLSFVNDNFYYIEHPNINDQDVSWYFKLYNFKDFKYGLKKSLIKNYQIQNKDAMDHYLIFLEILNIYIKTFIFEENCINLKDKMTSSEITYFSKITKYIIKKYY